MLLIAIKGANFKEKKSIDKDSHRVRIEGIQQATGGVANNRLQSPWLQSLHYGLCGFCNLHLASYSTKHN